jgi:hypothetical protein
MGKGAQNPFRALAGNDDDRTNQPGMACDDSPKLIFNGIAIAKRVVPRKVQYPQGLRQWVSNQLEPTEAGP